jgi:hypothetical protein
MVVRSTPALRASCLISGEATGSRPLRGGTLLSPEDRVAR